jgi:Tol biopolymer transport system component
MNPDGSGQTRVTNDTYDDSMPCVSPDGSKVAFSTSRNSSYCASGQCDLYVINTDGTGLAQLINVGTRTAYNILGCLWSNDGSKVYFGGTDVPGDQHQQLWVVNANGTGQQMILSRISSNRALVPASLSPDGTTILLRDTGLDSVFSTVRTDGTGYCKGCISGGPDDAFGRWNADGTSVAYTGGTPGRIFVMNGAGSDYPGTNITNDANDNEYPAWSPDGAKIGYTSRQGGGYWHILGLNADGGNKAQLTEGDYDDYNPVWFADTSRDLVVAGLYVAPTVVAPGAGISVTDITKNRVGGPTGLTTTAFYVSPTCTTTPTGSPVAGRGVPSLSGGESSTATTFVPLPGTTGTYYIIARADDADVITESNESNNTKCSAPVTVAYPDLVISSAYAPNSAKRGTAMSITDTTKNRLPGLAGASTTSFYLSTNTAVSGAVATLGSRAVPALAEGAQSTATSSVTIPASTTPGTYYIIWMADSGNIVPEADESNNTKYKAIAIIK